MRRRLITTILDHISIIPFLLFAFFPFYWMLITSLKKNSELYDLKSIPFWIKEGITLDHYFYLLQKTEFLTWLSNTIIVSILPTIISLIISFPAAYALARLRFRGAILYGMGIFAVYLIPPTLLFIPFSRIISYLKLSNSIWSLIIVYPSFMIPFSTLILSAYFKTLPREVEDSAMIDGCNRLQIIYKIVIPLSIPGVITSILFSFVFGWQNLIYTIAFISSSSQKTLSAGMVTELIRGDVFYWGSLMAGALLAALPIVLVFAFLMDYYISGLSAGAIK